MTENKELPVIISLTSIQSRLNEVSHTIESLLNQSLKADRIVLWLSEKSHLLDDGIKEIPDELSELTKMGLEIKWTKNIGPYRKLIPTAKLMNRENCLIVTADDRVEYPKDWLKGLVDEYNKNEGCVICYQGRIMDESNHQNKWRKRKGLKPYAKWTRTHEVEDTKLLGPNLDIFPDGRGGVLYPSERLHEEIFNKSIYLKMAPQNEDLWFKAITMITDTKVKCVQNNYSLPETEDLVESRYFGLVHTDPNDQVINQLFERYRLI